MVKVDGKDRNNIFGDGTDAKENGDWGVERLPVVLNLVFGSDQRQGCKFHKVPHQQLPLEAFFCAKKKGARGAPINRLAPHFFR